MRIFDTRSGIYGASVLALVAVLNLPAARAADDAGSLENIWAEQGQHPQQAQSSAESAGVPAVGAAAPMCSVDDLQKSALALKGGWPGIGPFKAGDEGPNNLVDPSGNHLRLTVLGGKVTV